MNEINRDNHYEELKREAFFISRQLIGRSPEPLLINKYIELHQIYFGGISDAERSFLRKVVDGDLPMEPIEYVTRNKYPILGKKINAVVYLMECCSAYDEFFHDTEMTPCRALFFLGWSAIRSPFIFVYGLFLRIRHGLF